MMARYALAVLCTLGDVVEDVVVWLNETVHYGTDTSARITRHRGGSAANVAAFAAAVSGRSRFVGQVGDDDTGERLLAGLRGGGVEPAVARGGRTGSIVVIVDPTGERTMLTDRGAAVELAALPPGAPDGIDTLHVPAYSLTIDPIAATARRAIEMCRARHVLVSIDASSESMLESFGTGRFLDLLRELRPDVFFCNRDEHRVLGLAPATAAPGCALTIVKAGGDPATIIENGTCTEVAVPPGGTIVDTTGAGDAFAAGFLLAYQRDRSARSAVEAGHRLAARVLAAPGASLA